MNPRFPFSSFPSGWFRVASSNQLAPGDVVPLHYFGRDLVLFRSQSGRLHLLDALCPHLGAHLAYEGQKFYLSYESAYQTAKEVLSN